MRRRRLHRVARAVGASALVALACAWLVGRVLSDRYAWSQPVSWVPPVVLAGPVWIAAMVGLARARRHRRRGGPARPLPARLALAIALLFSLVSASHLVFTELGLHRLARGWGGAGQPVRIVFWNQAGRTVGDIGETFLGHEPTLFVLANRHSSTGTRRLAQQFIDTGEAHAAVGWPFDLFSRLPIRRWASTSLGLDGRSRTVEGPTRPDPGWAAWYEVQTDAGPLIVWAIDLPSDPALARYPLAAEAGRAIATWRGTVRTVEDGKTRATRTESAGFPKPDLIVGDFNIPRHSASLDAFCRAAGAPGMRDAFGIAGAGWQRTWPRRFPVWAIDHCLVAEDLSVTSFETPDPGFGGHRALVVEFTRR